MFGEVKSAKGRAQVGELAHADGTRWVVGGAGAWASSVDAENIIRGPISME